MDSTRHQEKTQIKYWYYVCIVRINYQENSPKMINNWFKRFVFPDLKLIEI